MFHCQKISDSDETLPPDDLETQAPEISQHHSETVTEQNTVSEFSSTSYSAYTFSVSSSQPATEPAPKKLKLSIQTIDPLLIDSQSLQLSQCRQLPSFHYTPATQL
ncbi:hypothetical protein DPMN_102314 [Dreissena polymorpha]|uniref:Uncharacterized protein n=1 Tax=Dreissena polymorpha TaxID=45954 RepID=A0A9D4LL66_DREPO|nr:hypothetical protein DPMN_102314 [Dreissena polymorpha]